MPQISFTKDRPALRVREGINLMKALQEAAVPVGASCSGEGVCAKCYVEIVEGAENLSPVTALEKSLLKKYSFPQHTRISCLVRVKGDIKIDAPYW